MAPLPWGNTKNQIRKKANALATCLRKTRFDSEAVAVTCARKVMRSDLRGGTVHELRAYECRIVNDDGSSHWHLTTRGYEFAVGYRGSLDARGWAEYLGITWTDEDNAACLAALEQLRNSKD